MSNESSARRRSQPLRARPVAEAAPDRDTAPSPVKGSGPNRRGGLGGRLGGAAGLFSNAGQVASVAAAVSREVAANTAEVTREVVQQASSRQPASAITTTLFNGFVNGAVRAASAVEEQTGINLTSSTTNVLFEGERSDHASAADAVASAVSRVGQDADGADHLRDELIHLSGTAIEARDELREHGRDLLKRSAMLDDPDEHPAFRSILRDMSPDEARIVCLLAQAGPQPTVELLEVDRMAKTTREIAHHVSLIGQEAGCIRPKLAPTYLDNLARLGVVFVRDFRTGTQDQYDLLYAQPEIEDAEPPGRRFVKHQTVDRSVELSMFGRQLYEMCFTESDDEVGRTADVTERRRRASRSVRRTVGRQRREPPRR